jgi:hypothetical protein
MRDGIKLSEAITGGGAAIFRHACGVKACLEAHRVALCEGQNAGMAEDEEPEFRASIMLDYLRFQFFIPTG